MTRTRSRRSLRTRSTLLLTLALGGCGHRDLGEDIPRETAVATLERVRGEATVGADRDGVSARVPLDAEVATADDALSRMTLDGGAELVLDAGSRVSVGVDEVVTWTAGRVYVEVRSGDAPVEIVRDDLVVRVLDGAVSLSERDGDRVLYVVRGEASYVLGRGDGATRGVIGAGEEGRARGEALALAPATLVTDWTGGLFDAGPDAAPAAGMGVLEARVPDEVGQARWPLSVRRLDVSVELRGQLAITEVTQEFFNPASETVEGFYRMRVPPGAVLQRFAVDREGRLVDGFVREEQQARQAYQAQVYRGSTDDPALLEWSADGTYRARIYPIPGGAVRRIVVRYVEWLAPREGGTVLYRYPMAGGRGAPHIQEFSFVAELGDGVRRVRTSEDATVEDERVELRRSDFRPHADLYVEASVENVGSQHAYRAAHTAPPRAAGSRTIIAEADERDYWYLPLRLPETLYGERGDAAVDVVIVADVSAATDRNEIELGRHAIEAIARQLRPNDRVAIVSADLSIRGTGHELASATPETLEALLDGLARERSGGATDLGATIASAAAMLDPARHGAIVYVGDGTPTVGELGVAALRERMDALAHPARLYAVGIGASADLDLLSALARGGGLAIRVEEPGQAAEAAFTVRTHLARPVLSRVSVAVGTTIENVFPRSPVSIARGDTLDVVGRITGTPPTSVTVTGFRDGEPFEETIAVRTDATDEAIDLRLRWAGERLAQSLQNGATREEIAELGTRYGLITPFTSYYVPSAREMANGTYGFLEHVPLLDRRRDEPTAAETFASIALGVALGPLTLSGCEGATQTRSAPEVYELPADMEEAPPAEVAAAPAPPPMPTTPGATVGAVAPATAPTSGLPDPDMPLAAVDPAAAPAPSARAAAARPAQPVDRPSREGVFDNSYASGDERAAAATEAERMIADGLGDAFGYGGLGVRGTGRGGGGAGQGTIGIGNIGTIGHGAGTGGGSGYGQGAGARRSRASTEAPTVVRTGTPNVTGGLSREVVRRVVQRHLTELRFCYEQGLARSPNLAGNASLVFDITSSGTAANARLTGSTVGDSQVEQCVSHAAARWAYPAPEGGTVSVSMPIAFGGGALPVPSPVVSNTRSASVTTEVRVTTVIRTTTTAADHTVQRCGDASNVNVNDRTSLWRERLAQRDAVSGWLDVFRDAERACEIRTARDRRAFLDVLLDRAATLPRMIELYAYLTDSTSRGFVRSAVLRRVRTADDLRMVRAAFGLSSTSDDALVRQVLERATTPRARVRALRALVADRPDSNELKLRLLEELETDGFVPEARRLALRLRHDPLADPGIRTAIGEMYLRFGDEDEARRVFSEIVEFQPYDEVARRRLGDLYRAHGWFDDAYRQYATLATIRPDDPSVLLLLAQAAAGAGRVDEALRLEGSLMEAADPQSRDGLARIALLWSSVRFAELRKAARAAHAEDELRALESRMRRSGVLRAASDLRATLVWSHPDADLALYGAHPGTPLRRPDDLGGEFGIESFDVEEAEAGAYRIEVRRTGQTRLTRLEAKLVVVRNEGEDDEWIETIPLVFDTDHRAFAWTIDGSSLAPTALSAEAQRLAAPVLDGGGQ